MDTIQVKLVTLNNGCIGLQYPKTPVLWNMEGTYVQSENYAALIKLTAEQVDMLVPKE